MEFTVRHSFECSADALWDIVMDPAYQAEVDRRAKLTREVMQDRKRGSERLLKIRFTPERTLPPAIARAAGTDSLAYVQEQRWRARDKSMKWVVIPDVMPDRIQSKGDFKIIAKGPASCERVVTGSVKVTVPVFGKRVEQHVADDVTRGYEATAELTREWIRERLA